MATRFSSPGRSDGSFSVPIIKGGEVCMQGTGVSPNSARGGRDDGTESVDGFGTIKVTASILGDDLFTLRCNSNWGCADILRRNCGGSGRCVSR